MTLQEFTTEFESATEKDQALLAGHYADLYLRYWVEVCGEELDG